MDFRDTAAEAGWRTEVRSFVEQHLGDERLSLLKNEVGLGGWDPTSPWRRSVAARGWLAPAWPKEFGGAGMTIGEQFILNEEFAKARAPHPGGVGVAFVGPTLIVHGSDPLKRRFLPAILSGETIWCQGFSEPGAGSDLASLQTRAVRDGDDYVINGQKIWTTMAQRASWCILLTRTNPEAPKHRGISMFLLDMRSPGITIRPLINMAGDHEFNELFFDNVRVPKENLVGEENRGWYVAATTLDFERSNITGAVSLLHAVDELVGFVREHRVAPPVRLALVDHRIEAEVCRLLSYRIVSLQIAGKVPNYEASISKLFGSETGQRVANTATRLLGLPSQGWRFEHVWDQYAAAYGRGYLRSVAGTIAAGTSEIQRNVIATRGLGLPRA